MSGRSSESKTAPATTLGPPPDRRPRSVRRTASIQSQWPEGILGPMVLSGAARDLYTGDDVSAPRELARETLHARQSPDRRIEALDAGRRSEVLATFRGLRPGGELRKAMLAAMPEEAERSTLLHRLLEDLSTANLVSTHAWAAWMPDWVERYRDAGMAARIDRDVTGVCIGFRPGSGALAADGRSNIGRQSRIVAPPPLRPDDPYAWHAFDPDVGPNQRRIRWIDLWREEDGLHAHAGFQDSAALPDASGDRAIFHEYRLQAVIHPQDYVLQAVAVTPAVLPYAECMEGRTSPERLLGAPVTGFRRAVSAALSGAAGCTHLNDVLRTLQDVPVLADALRSAKGAA